MRYYVALQNQNQSAGYGGPPPSASRGVYAPLVVEWCVLEVDYDDGITLAPHVFDSRT